MNLARRLREVAERIGQAEAAAARLPVRWPAGSAGVGACSSPCDRCDDRTPGAYTMSFVGSLRPGPFEPGRDVIVGDLNLTGTYTLDSWVPHPWPLIPLSGLLPPFADYRACSWLVLLDAWVRRYGTVFGSPDEYVERRLGLLLQKQPVFGPGAGGGPTVLANRFGLYLGEDGLISTSAAFLGGNTTEPVGTCGAGPYTIVQDLDDVMITPWSAVLTPQ